MKMAMLHRKMSTSSDPAATATTTAHNVNGDTIDNNSAKDKYVYILFNWQHIKNIFDMQ